jgi:hypothetical protein
MGSLSTVTVGRPVLAARMPALRGNCLASFLEEHSRRAYCHTCCVTHGSHNTSLDPTLTQPERNCDESAQNVPEGMKRRLSAGSMWAIIFSPGSTATAAPY